MTKLAIATLAAYTNAVVAIAVFAVPDGIVGAVGIPISAEFNEFAFNDNPLVVFAVKSETAVYTKFVVAIALLLSELAGVGDCGLPVNIGLAAFAFKLMFAPVVNS